MNRRAFDACMAYNGDTRDTLATALNVKVGTVGNKIRGATDFKLSEICILRRRWNLSTEKLLEVFFDEPIRNKDN